MSKNSFQFQKFSINQQKSAMKVSADAITFAAWIPIGKYANILDIGTGTGVLSLIIASRFNDAKIDSVEIDCESFTEAKENFEKSNYADCISIYHSDIMLFESERKYDLVMCNPPFFNQSILPSNPKLAIAKHDENLQPKKLFEAAKKHLSENGIFYTLYPFARKEEILKTANEFELNLTYEFSIHKNKQASARLLFMTFSNKKTDLLKGSLAMHNDNGSFTQEYLDLIEPYYLKPH